MHGYIIQFICQHVIKHEKHRNHFTKIFLWLPTINSSTRCANPRPHLMNLRKVKNGVKSAKSVMHQKKRSRESAGERLSVEDIYLLTACMKSWANNRASADGRCHCPFPLLCCALSSPMLHRRGVGSKSRRMADAGNRQQSTQAKVKRKIWYKYISTFTDMGLCYGCYPLVDLQKNYHAHKRVKTVITLSISLSLVRHLLN